MRAQRLQCKVSSDKPSRRFCNYDGVRCSDSLKPCCEIRSFAENRTLLRGTLPNDVPDNDQARRYPDSHLQLLAGKTFPSQSRLDAGDASARLTMGSSSAP